MPRGDGTGPMGGGPMSGRGAGYCAGYGAPGYANPSYGRGFGSGGGGRGGRGWRHRYYATGVPGWAAYGPAPGFGWPAPIAAPPQAGPVAMSKDDEIEALRRQAGSFEEALAGIQEGLAELSSDDGE